MLQSIGDVREGFICPECRQDMSTIEMLQIHFEDVHVKQISSSSSAVKGIEYLDIFNFSNFRVLLQGYFP